MTEKEPKLRHYRIVRYKRRRETNRGDYHIDTKQFFYRCERRWFGFLWLPMNRHHYWTYDGALDDIKLVAGTEPSIITYTEKNI